MEEVVGLVERQKKRLHYAGSRINLVPASKELRQMPLFQGLLDDNFVKVRKCKGDAIWQSRRQLLAREHFLTSRSCISHQARSSWL